MRVDSLGNDLSGHCFQDDLRLPAWTTSQIVPLYIPFVKPGDQRLHSGCV